MSKIKTLIKVEYAKKYLQGDGSYQSLGDEIGVVHSTIKDWVRNYITIGVGALNCQGTKNIQKN